MAAGVQRVAAAYALYRQPAALQGAKTGDRLHGVLRATGSKPAARPQQRAYEAFVEPQDGNEGAVDHAWMICDLG